MTESIIVRRSPQRSLNEKLLAALRPRKLLRFAWRTLLAPLRLFQTLRRALTPASVTLVLMGIVSTNIIWGYPWIGAFSACTALLVIGFIINRWSLGELAVDYRLPRSATAGAPFQSNLLLTNRSRFPSLELEISLEPSLRRQRKAARDLQTKLVDHTIPIIYPADTIQRAVTIVYHQRGIYRLPAAVVTNWFPFYLFRYTKVLKTRVSIPVTPALLSDQEDLMARHLQDALGDWSRKLLAGEAIDYTGSREYVAGMPVRRWDFASWARLGQPIIREYQSPSVRMVVFIVDTCIEGTPGQQKSDSKILLEQVLSCAATAVDRICHQNIHIRLFVTGQDLPSPSDGPADREGLLIRLAAADLVSTEIADQGIAEGCQLIRQAPALLITARDLADHDGSLPPSLSTLVVGADRVTLKTEANDPNSAAENPAERGAV